MTIQTLIDESKRIVRDPIAKVIITWTDPLIDVSLNTETSENNRVSYPVQVADLVTDIPRKWFHTNDTDVTLDGEYYPAPSTLKEARKSQMGWWGTQSALPSGLFTSNPSISVLFTRRLVEGVTVTGDNAYGEYPVDYKVTVYITSGGIFEPVEILNIAGNTQVSRYDAFTGLHSYATKIELEVIKWSAPDKVVKIAEFYSSVVEEFASDDIMLLSILQEFEAAEGTLPIGNISCNEIDLSLQNITDRFYSENTNSDIHSLIKRNRKIEPFLGFRYRSGVEEFIPMGLYWSGDWATSDNSTSAQTSARDRFELLRKKDFPYEEVFTEVLSDVSIKFLMTEVLDSLYGYMYDFYYDISDVDDAYIVPYFDPEFFKKKTYFQVVKDLAVAGLLYVYMDTPTESEIEENGILCKDMFRAKKLDTVFPQSVYPSDAIQITKADFIDKTQLADTESMANSIKVVYKVFSKDESGEWDSVDTTFPLEDADSISEYGVMEYEYETSNLIQLESHAEDVATSLLASFKVPKPDIDINAFGDVTLELANQLSVPEYQKNGIDNKGIFAISKLQAQFDGSLRMVISGRKLAADNSGVEREGRGVLAQPSIRGLSGVPSFPSVDPVSGYAVEPFTIGREADTYVVPDAAGPVFTTQPETQYVILGDTATYDSVDTGVSRQWSNSANGVIFADIVGDTTNQSIRENIGRTATPYWEAGTTEHNYDAADWTKVQGNATVTVNALGITITRLNEAILTAVVSDIQGGIDYARVDATCTDNTSNLNNPTWYFVDLFDAVANSRVSCIYERSLNKFTLVTTINGTTTNAVVFDSGLPASMTGISIQVIIQSTTDGDADISIVMKDSGGSTVFSSTNEYTNAIDVTAVNYHSDLIVRNMAVTSEVMRQEGAGLPFTQEAGDPFGTYYKNTATDPSGSTDSDIVQVLEAATE